MFPKNLKLSQLPMFTRIAVFAVPVVGGTAISWYALKDLGLWIAGGLLLAIILVALYFRLLKCLRNRDAGFMSIGILRSLAARVAPSDPEIAAKIDELRTRFEEGIETFRQAGKTTYDLPWYLFLGESGSGKTEAIRHSGIRFPSGLHDRFQGTGGTVNMDWWFTKHGVILDTAGRLMFEQGQAARTSEWKEFLRLLFKYRSRCPINGAFLTIPVDSLISDTREQIEQKAGTIARQLDMIRRTLDVKFPVYVLVTKSDLIYGFREFFDHLKDPDLEHQMLGWSNPDSLDALFKPECVGEYLSQIKRRLVEKRLECMKAISPKQTDDSDRPAVEAAYAFPESFSQITSRLTQYLQLIFDSPDEPWSSPLFVRGIYFTSSLQEGVALDEDLAKILGIPLEELPGKNVWKRDKAYFLRDLFLKKVFQEKGLVTNASNTKKLWMRRQAALYCSGIVCVLVMIVLTIFTWNSFRRGIEPLRLELEHSEKMVSDYQSIVQSVFAEPNDPTDLDVYEYVGGKEKEYDLGKWAMETRLTNLVQAMNGWKERPRNWLERRFQKKIRDKDLHEALQRIYIMAVLKPLAEGFARKMEQTEAPVDSDYSKFKEAMYTSIDIAKGKSVSIEGLKQLTKYLGCPDAGEKESLQVPLTYLSKVWDQGLITNIVSEQHVRKMVIAFTKYWERETLYWETKELSKHPADNCANFYGLCKALKDFDSREVMILESYRNGCYIEDFSDWGEHFQKLQDAWKKIDDYANMDFLKDQTSLKAVWDCVSEERLAKIQEEYDGLLMSLGDMPYDDLCRTAQNSLVKVKNIEEPNTKDLDKLWAKHDREQEYKRRYTIYAKAGEIHNCNSIVKMAGKIKEMNLLDSNVTPESDKAEACVQHIIVRQWLYLSEQQPECKDVKALAEAIKNEGDQEDKSDWNQSYNITVAGDVLGAWRDVRNALERHNMELSEKVSDLYENYRKAYLDYVLRVYPEEQFRKKGIIVANNSWKKHHSWLRDGIMVPTFVDHLQSIAKTVNSALEAVSEGRSDTSDIGWAKRLRKACDDWANLSHDARKARRSLLGLSTEEFQDQYDCFSDSRNLFDIYGKMLFEQSFNLLLNEAKEKLTEECEWAKINILDRFPFIMDGVNLAPGDLDRTRELVRDLLLSYEDGNSTHEMLRQLRTLNLPQDKIEFDYVRLGHIKAVLNMIPKESDRYYWKLWVLTLDRDVDSGYEFLGKFIKEMRLVSQETELLPLAVVRLMHLPRDMCFDKSDRSGSFIGNFPNEAPKKRMFFELGMMNVDNNFKTDIQTPIFDGPWAPFKMLIPYENEDMTFEPACDTDGGIIIKLTVIAKDGKKYMLKLKLEYFRNVQCDDKDKIDLSKLLAAWGIDARLLASD